MTRPRSYWHGRWVAWPALTLAGALLSGCGEHLVRRDSQDALVRGDYESALRRLEAGVQEFPDSTPLRSALLQARTEALTRQLSQVASLRAQGRLDEALAALKRAATLDPGNARVQALLDEVTTGQRQQAALAAIEADVGQQPVESLLARIGAALQDDRRHPGLLALQRRLELELRQAAAAGQNLALAETRPITLDFRDASLRMVLDVVSRHSGINFIIDRDVRPETRVTVFLRQARVEDALDLIVSTGQLAKKVVDAQTIVVYPDTPEKRRQYQEQVVRVFHLNSADAKGAAAFLRAMAGVREPFVDERANLIALRDAPENIRLAERLIALYDTAEPEVLLELEVLEVSSSRLLELGVRFPDTFSLTPLAPAGSAGLTLGNIQGLNSDRIGVGVAGLLINLRREVGDFTTLANPSIRVRNRQSAKVMVGDKIPVVTTTTGTGGFVSDSVSYLDVGLKLEVEPTVHADDDVGIKVSLEVSTLGPSTKTASGTLAYQIGTRNASTLLRLRDGETQLLAGLISREDRSSASRVPGVGDLPVLGRLFSNQLDDGIRKELVLAITPRILRNQRRLEASEAELWVGTEARPGLRRPPGATMARPASAAGAPSAQPMVPMAPAATVAAATPPAPAVATLRWQGRQELAVGDVLEAQLTLDSPAPLRGLPLELVYDPRLLALEAADEGDYFRRDGSRTSFSHSVEAKDGLARFGVIRTQATGASGAATVLRLRFKALAPGMARLRVQRADPVQLTPGSVRLTAPVDWPVTIR